MSEDNMKVEKESGTYDGAMDAECIALCDAINSIQGLRTTSSCCGHGERPFSIGFSVDSLEHFPLLLYYIVPCHIGFRWRCEAYTDCSMSPVMFSLESESVGEQAYQEAATIAEKVLAYLSDAHTPADTPQSEGEE